MESLVEKLCHRLSGVTGSMHFCNCKRILMKDIYVVLLFIYLFILFCFAFSSNIITWDLSYRTEAMGIHLLLPLSADIY